MRVPAWLIGTCAGLILFGAVRADDRDEWLVWRDEQIEQLRAIEAEINPHIENPLGNLHWTTAESPVRIDRNFELSRDATLTIDPGVEVIVDRGSRLEFYGTLRAIGTAAEPIIFKFIGNPPSGEIRPDLAHSITFWDSSRAEIRFTKFFDARSISVYSDSRFVFEDNTLEDFKASDMVLFQADQNGLHPQFSIRRNTIAHNNVAKSLVGIHIFEDGSDEGQQSGEIVGNRITTTGWPSRTAGIHLWRSTGNLVIRDNLLQFGLGTTRDISAISIWERSENLLIERNEVSGNPLAQHSGILLWTDHGSARLARNKVSGTRRGMEIWDGSPLVERNELFDNDIGLLVADANPRLVRNKIFNNRIGIEVVRNAPSLVSLGNLITGNREHGVVNRRPSQSFAVAQAWWGDRSGPSGEGLSGAGDRISVGVAASPWLLRENRPVVLVPGIGASFNVSLLKNPDDQKAVPAGWRFTPFVNHYDGLVTAFEKAGYVMGEDLFIAYYDWRLPNADSARLYLESMIDRAKAASGHPKVIVVAHSMGGIAARAYVQGVDYKDDVDALIMLGTPNQGTPKAYPVWAGGELPPDWWMIRPYLWFIKVNNNVFSDFTTIRTYFRSVKELLPTYPALVESPSNLEKKITDLLEPNLFVHNLNNKNIAVDIYSISGSGLSTRSKFFVKNVGVANKWLDGQPIAIQPPETFTDGDRTVPKVSANFGKEKEVSQIQSSHEKLPTDAIPKIFEIIESRKPQGQFRADPVERFLQIAFASPVTATVTAPDGTTYQPIILDELKLFTIPNPIDGTYTVQLTGTGDGQYHTLVAYDDAPANQSLVQELEAKPIKKDQNVTYSITLDSTGGDLTINDTTPPSSPPPPTGGPSVLQSPTPTQPPASSSPLSQVVGFDKVKTKPFKIIAEVVADPEAAQAQVAGVKEIADEPQETLAIPLSLKVILAAIIGLLGGTILRGKRI